MLDAVAPGNYDTVNFCASLQQKGVTDYVACGGGRFDQNPLVTSQEEGRLSHYLWVWVNLHNSGTFWPLNVSFRVAVESDPEWHDFNLFVKLHHVRIVWGVSIRVRWQEVHVFLLLRDMIETNFVRWPFLAQHDLLRERYYKLDRRRVNLAEGLCNGIVLFFWNIIVHEEFQYESELFFDHLNSNDICSLVIR